MPLDDTGLLVHPRSPDPYCRGIFHAGVARRQLESARRLRIAGEVSAARFALRAAAVERKNAAHEFGITSRATTRRKAVGGMFVERERAAGKAEGPRISDADIRAYIKALAAKDRAEGIE